MRYRSEALLFPLVCLAILAGYFWTSAPAVPQYGLLEPSQQHFNQLVAGFRSGQLSLKQEPAPEMAKLADPYDPRQNAKYQLHDASYYHGRYYIYYGITPALILFWPYVALTGHYLAQKYAVTVFCSAGFLIAAAIVWRIRRRYFPAVGTGVLLAMVVAVGTVNATAFLLRRPEMYEVSVSCAYALVMAALAAMGCALSGGRRPLLWTALASLFLGMAVGARPSFLFGSASILIPVAYLLKNPGGASEAGGSRWMPLLCAFLPLACIGFGLAAYNYLRFGNPLEFGTKYLLMQKEVTRFFSYSPSWIWLNARFNLFLPTGLSEYFPFVRGIDIPDVPPGYAFIENPFGVLANIPFVLLGFAAPLAWRRRQSADALRLRLFVLALAWIAATSLAVLLVFVVASIRYESDFTPYLVMLGVLGVFGIEARLADRPRFRSWTRAGWGCLLAVSVAFNFFGSCQHDEVLKRDAPSEYQALSRFFDYPAYSFRRILSGVRASPPSGPCGPLSLKIRLPPKGTGEREPLLVIGKARDSGIVAFLRCVAKDQVSFGFEFPGGRMFESMPIRVDPGTPLNVVVYSPQLLADLGDPRWGRVAYLKQLSGLGLYAITVNGFSALAGNAPLDEPIDFEAPLCVAADPVGIGAVSSHFTGEVLERSRLGMGESLLAQ